MLEEHIGKPLSAIPDPFGTHESLGAHNNARLMAFLDDFGFKYEFMSSTDCYKSGKFDKDFRKDGLKSNSEFDGIITKNPQYNNLSRRIGRAHPDPLSAGAKTGDAEVDRIKKQTGRLN